MPTITPLNLNPIISVLNFKKGFSQILRIHCAKRATSWNFPKKLVQMSAHLMTRAAVCTNSIAAHMLVSYVVCGTLILIGLADDRSSSMHQ
jgi:hypothetical protein